MNIITKDQIEKAIENCTRSNPGKTPHELMLMAAKYGEMSWKDLHAVPRSSITSATLKAIERWSAHSPS